MADITSAQNPVIRKLKSLNDKKGRENTGLMLVEGEIMIREALKAGLHPSEALIEDNVRFGGLADLLRGCGSRLYTVPRSLIENVCGTMTPQGVCAAFRMPAMRALEGELPDLFVALNGLQDPGNVGTIWRTADAAGFGALLTDSSCADPFSPKVQRSAMGSGFRLPVYAAQVMSTALKTLQARGYAVVVSALDGQPFYDAVLPKGKVVLVIGSEAHGASEDVKTLADLRLKLPMRGGAESLNAAVAAGIMMYEITKETGLRGE